MMKALISATLMALGSLTPALAQTGPYFGIGLGASFPGNMPIDASNDVMLPGNNFETIVDETIDLDPNGSVAGAVWVGYRITPSISLEAERFVQWSTIDDDLVDDDFDFDLFGQGENNAIGMWAANVIIAAPKEIGARPYIGVGVGRVTFDTEEDQLAGFEDDNPWGFQLKGGSEYIFEWGGTVGIQMRYFTMARPLERTFERQVIQSDQSVVTTQLREELDYSGIDLMLTAGLRF